MAASLPLSLFERLLDEAPGQALDQQESEEATFTRFKLGLRRDLEGLLNGKRPHADWLTRAPDVADTVIGFGLPDLSTEDFGTPAVRERIRRLIATCIRTFEPRLSRIEVEADGSGPTSAGLRFRISAVARIAAVEEPVVYDARLLPTDRVIAVKLAR